MRVRVVCGFADTIATFVPTSRFVSVDFPTFGLPTTEIMALFVISIVSFPVRLFALMRVIIISIWNSVNPVYYKEKIFLSGQPLITNLKHAIKWYNNSKSSIINTIPHDITRPAVLLAGRAVGKKDRYGSMVPP